MEIKHIKAKQILDSRNKKTIQIILETSSHRFITSAPEGKSTGEYEVKPYFESLNWDIDYINDLNEEEINNLFQRFFHKKILDKENAFVFLEKVEDIVKNKIGANTLYCLEACLLKAIAWELNKELYSFILDWDKPSFSSANEKNSRFATDGRRIMMPRPVGNAIGGGLHSRGRKGKKPDFQEFLFIPHAPSFRQCVEINENAYKLAKKYLGYLIAKRNDEGAYESDLSNEQVLLIMKKVQEEIESKNKVLQIGIDAAASSFFDTGIYKYDNPYHLLNRKMQIDYMSELANKFKLFYIEDPLEDNDFIGFQETKKKILGNCLIVGDDLTTTNPERLSKAIKHDSINAIIIKPNQIGSLVKMKKTIEMAKMFGIKTIMSHRSGETMDYTIADLCVGFGCDFIKTGIYGKERKGKLNRLIEIENRIGR